MVRNASGDFVHLALARRRPPIGRLPSATRSFIRCEGRNDSTRRGRIGTSSPVFGLRPTRSALSRTEKVPKDEIFTVSPLRQGVRHRRQHRSTSCDRFVAATVRPRGTPLRSDPSASVSCRPSPHPPSFCGNHKARRISESISTAWQGAVVQAAFKGGEPPIPRPARRRSPRSPPSGRVSAGRWRTPTDSARGIDAAEVLPWSCTVTTTRSIGTCSLCAVAAMIRRLA